jgi:hypothetical protein
MLRYASRAHCRNADTAQYFSRKVKQLFGEAMSDNVNHPTHYNTGKIEVIEFIEDQQLVFHLGNAVKYIARAGKKDASKTVEDLKKAVWYLQRHIELLEAVKANREPLRPNDMNVGANEA